jgi:hypothetical protein
MPERHESTGLSNALIICDKDVDHAILSTLLENNDFPVSTTQLMLTQSDVDNYGVIIHIGYSQDLLEKRLGDKLNEIKDEEWIFMAGGENRDLHCTVEVTKKASNRLRKFIRLLWSKFSVP